MANWQSSPCGPPETPGVYAVVCFTPWSNRCLVLYIGSAKNIKKRVHNRKHWYRKIFDSHSYPNIIAIKYRECSNYLELERALIKKLKPEFNLQHSGKEYRSKLISLNG